MHNHKRHMKQYRSSGAINSMRAFSVWAALVQTRALMLLPEILLKANGAVFTA
jgi:hypothetical protein